MQFTVTINQAKALEWGLNAQQATLFAFVYECPSWARPVTTDNGVYFALAKTKIVEELPLLTDKPDTAYRLLKALEKHGVIELSSTNSITLVRLTAKGKTWNKKLDGSEKYPTSEKSPTKGRKNIRAGSEKSPTNQGTSNQPPTLSGVRENIFKQAAQSDDDGLPVAGKSHQFPMSLDWAPNPEMFAAQCLRACLPTDTQYAPHQLAKFTAHFADQPHRRHGESAWIAKLVDWVRNDIRRAKTAEQNSPGVRHASRQQPNATRSERDRVAEVLANPDDTSWMEGLFSQGETNFEPCEPGVYENGGDFPTDVEDIVYDREDGHAGEAGGSGFHDAVADAADASEPGCSTGANQGGGQRVAAERGAPDCDAQATTRGPRHA